MGKLIDVDKFLKRVEKDRKHEIYMHSWTADDVLRRLDSWYAPPVKAIPKADYEARLKADMVAMLEELILEANELEDPKYILEMSELPLDVDGTTLPLETYALQCYCRGGEEVIDIIEKKINSLKENKDE